MNENTYLFKHGGLSTRAAAALIGRSPHTLIRARHDRYDLDMPPSTPVGKRTVVYTLFNLRRWSLATGQRLHWDRLPLVVALPIFDAYEAQGLIVPVGLREAMARVRRGRP